MEAHMDDSTGRRWSLWRIAGWSAAALLLLTPLVAMQFTDEVDWTVSDFVFAAVLLLSVGIPLELIVRRTSDITYRAAFGVALLTAFLLVWVNGAVGIIGSEDEAVNLLYGGVLAVGLLGTLLARFRPRGMARVLLATALAQASVAVGAMAAGAGGPESGPVEIVAVNGFFVTLWLASAVLFRNAAEDAERSAV